MKYSLRNFAISVIIGLIIFGAFGFSVSGYAEDFMVDLFTPGGSDHNNSEDDDLTPVNDDSDIENIPVASGRSFTFLVISLTEDRKVDSAELVKFREAGKHILIVSIPTNMVMSDKGTLQLLEDVYTTYWLSYVQASITARTGLPIDGSFVYYKEDIASIVSICGGISVTLSENVAVSGNKTYKKGTQLLQGADVFGLLTKSDSSATFAGKMNVHRDVLLGIVKTLLTINDQQKMPIETLYPELLSYIDTSFTLMDIAQNQEFFQKALTYAVTHSVFPGKETHPDENTETETPDTENPQDEIPGEEKPVVIPRITYTPHVEEAITTYKSFR